MSTGLNCRYFETEKQEWYYVLESSRGSKSAWDWMEEASVVGPFPTSEKAYDHLHAHNANPGSSFTVSHAETTEKERHKYAGLVGRATRPSGGALTRPYLWR